MAEPFATVADLEARWRPLTDQERATAGTLLGDASVVIRAEAPRWAKVDRELLLITACDLVRRKMEAAEDGVASGVESTQLSVGPFQESMRYSNPTADLYLTSAERARLGIGRQRAFSIDMAPPMPVTPRPWDWA